MCVCESIVWYSHQPQTQTETNDGAKSVELKKLGTTQEHEDKDKDQSDKIGWNENTRLMCQWLVLIPLKWSKEDTSIYIVS